VPVEGDSAHFQKLSEREERYWGQVELKELGALKPRGAAYRSKLHALVSVGAASSDSSA